MREIKFRGRRRNGEWMYGALIPAELSWWGVPSIADKNFRYEVDPETIGQYTGYKDVEGKEIYEGDILKSADKLPFVVKFGANLGKNGSQNLGFYTKFAHRYRGLYRQDFCGCKFSRRDK